jgi:NAD(P)-dependent dehydrogenase (short-subunit alcohol dehydrogenase family)
VKILALDVTSASDIQRAADDVDTLDVLINNAGIANFDDLSNSGAIAQHLAVNLFGPFNVTRAFLPLLRRSKGAIVNNLSLVALAALPMIPAYSISKAAAFNMTQSLRALLAGEGVSVHAVVLGPIDTDMNRGFDIPKAPPESAARGIFDGLERGEEDIFPDPASESIAEGWRAGAQARPRGLSASSHLSCRRAWRKLRDLGWRHIRFQHRKAQQDAQRMRVKLGISEGFFVAALLQNDNGFFLWRKMTVNFTIASVYVYARENAVN